MKILIIADVYPPEVSSAATLVQELAQGFKAAGDEVGIVTTEPRYYLAGERRGEEWREVVDENGIKIIRVKTPPLKRVFFVVRGISQLLLPFLIFRKVKKYIKGKLDGVIVYSPPITLSVAGNLVKKKYGAKFILIMQDIFPQNAIDLGILRDRIDFKIFKNKVAIKFLEHIEGYAYRNADIITFHSEGGRQFLIDKKNVPPEKIISLPNWVDFSPYEVAQKKDFKKEYGLENKKVLLFAGIMGPAQGLDFLLEVAEKCADIKDLIFLLVGGGMEESRLKEFVAKKNLRNVIFKPFVSKEDYPDLVRSMDAGLVCLSSQNKTPFIPGKFLGYMAAGMPVLAFLNKESDAFELVDKIGCGFASIAGDLDAAIGNARMISRIGAGELLAMGANGHRYAKDNSSLESATEKIREMIKIKSV